MILIKATLKTEAPLSIAMPIAQGGRENDCGNFPLLVRGLNEEGEKLYTGYLPATTLRGFLRRAIVIENMKTAAEAGKHYKLPQAYAELIGQDPESEQQAGDIDLVALKQVRENSPVLDLFGSGLGIKSRLKVSHFMPTHNVRPDAITGVRKDLDDNEDAFNLIDKSEQSTFFDRSEANSKRARADKQLKSLNSEKRAAKRANKSIEDIDAKIKAAENLVKSHEAEMGDMQNSSRTILTHYALAAGLNLDGKLIIEHPKDRDVDLLIIALKALSLSPILGAQSARGCGEISGIFDFTKEGKLFKKVTIGSFEAAKIDDF